MTAWQYLAGAGLVAALCPLHGHVAVAGDGHGRGARVDLCVPAGRPERPDRPAQTGRPTVRPPEARPSARPSARPPVRATVPGTDRATVHHPGRAALPAAPAAPGAQSPPEPYAEAGAADPKPPEPAPGAEPAPAPVPAVAAAPPRSAAAARVSAFHVRPYRAVALERRGPGGLSTMMLMVVVTTPAVLAAAALRPRSKGRG
ncbi:hypothetical protein [Streptomyces antarcticus]|uniref:hypothetical protein n=1 Tax=Streptomyces antarcticus TaxID=2996458 RepID=UPI002270F53C|nr:hypothetical protein [Streptomyces sp. H34-AA3]MCY0940358.1 hypothetical protein [Streptomyces sp. H34-AA3]